MFTVYKKIKTPETSPVLGPASSNLAPITNGINANNANNANNTNNNGLMESVSLCNYCCSPRTKQKHDKHGDAPIQIQAQDKAAQDKAAQDKAAQEDPMQCPIKPNYEFGHATHYVYGVTTPRLLCDFETGTPPSP
jgi:hypothetical protein